MDLWFCLLVSAVGLSYLEGLNIMNKARFVMWERVVELKPFD